MSFFLSLSSSNNLSNSEEVEDDEKVMLDDDVVVLLVGVMYAFVNVDNLFLVIESLALVDL